MNLQRNGIQEGRGGVGWGKEESWASVESARQVASPQSRMRDTASYSCVGVSYLLGPLSSVLLQHIQYILDNRKLRYISGLSAAFLHPL